MLIAVTTTAVVAAVVVIAVAQVVTMVQERNNRQVVAPAEAGRAVGAHGVHRLSGTFTRTITRTLVWAIRCFNHRMEPFSRVPRRQPSLY